MNDPHNEALAFEEWWNKWSDLLASSNPTPYEFGKAIWVAACGDQVDKKGEGKDDVSLPKTGFASDATKGDEPMLLVAWMQANRIEEAEARKLVRKVWFYRDQIDKNLSSALDALNSSDSEVDELLCKLCDRNQEILDLRAELARWKSQTFKDMGWKEGSD